MAYDPDAEQRALEAVDAAQFGRLIAKAILASPKSQNYALVQDALEPIAPMGVDWNQTKALVHSIAASGNEDGA